MTNQAKSDVVQEAKRTLESKESPIVHHSEKNITGYEFYKWPEFIALAKRLGFPYDSPIRDFSIQVPLDGMVTAKVELLMTNRNTGKFPMNTPVKVFNLDGSLFCEGAYLGGDKKETTHGLIATSMGTVSIPDSLIQYNREIHESSSGTAETDSGTE